MFAVANGETALIAPLLARGANTSLRAENGWTPLMFACALGHYEAVAALLEASLGDKDQSLFTTQQAMLSMQSAHGLAREHEQPGVTALLSHLLEQDGTPDVSAALLHAREAAQEAEREAAGACAVSWTPAPLPTKSAKEQGRVSAGVRARFHGRCAPVRAPWRRHSPISLQSPSSHRGIGAPLYSLRRASPLRRHVILACPAPRASRNSGRCSVYGGLANGPEVLADPSSAIHDVRPLLESVQSHGRRPPASTDGRRPSSDPSAEMRQRERWPIWCASDHRDRPRTIEAMEA